MSKTIAEKHADIMNGAVYKDYKTAFSKGKDGVPADGEGFVITMNEWRNMTLKTPAPKPEYSREFEIMEPWVMAKLMCEGESLEFENRGTAVYDREDGVFRHNRGVHKGIVHKWDAKCRVYQAPKKEIRWFWEKACPAYTSRTNVKLSAFKIESNYSDFKLWIKVADSAEEFTIEDGE